MQTIEIALIAGAAGVALVAVAADWLADLIHARRSRRYLAHLDRVLSARH